MKSNTTTKYGNLPFLILILLFFAMPCRGQETVSETKLDTKVESFLNDHSSQWRDMNVPASDGQLLFDIIVENNYTNAVEIGTSTGHSTIWIAWAMSKTGGKVITIEIDENRYKEALENFEKAGVSEFIDARLADAHELVPNLEGTFDFVFSDADKDWYTTYFKALDSKLKSGGCFTAHNVRPLGRGRGMRGAQEYLEYVSKLENYKTTVDSSGNGLAISYKN